MLVFPPQTFQMVSLPLPASIVALDKVLFMVSAYSDPAIKNGILKTETMLSAFMTLIVVVVPRL